VPGKREKNTITKPAVTADSPEAHHHVGRKNRQGGGDVKVLD
jgi:hypothetical protein